MATIANHADHDNHVKQHIANHADHANHANQAPEYFSQKVLFPESFLAVKTVTDRSVVRTNFCVPRGPRFGGARGAAGAPAARKN